MVMIGIITIFYYYFPSIPMRPFLVTSMQLYGILEKQVNVQFFVLQMAVVHVPNSYFAFFIC